MTDQSQLPPAQATASDERVLPIIAYATYIAAPLTVAITAVIGVIIAHAGRDSASPLVRSHYEFLIRTFWIGLVALIVGGAALGVGIVLSVILIGIPIVVLASVFLGLACVWFVVRAVVGLVYVVQNQPYPRPYTYLV